MEGKTTVPEGRLARKIEGKDERRMRPLDSLEEYSLERSTDGDNASLIFGLFPNRPVALYR